MARTSVILTNALRNEAAYRQTRWAAGFLLKPTRGGYTTKRDATFVGVYVLRGNGQFTDGDGHTHDVCAGAFCQHHMRQTYTLKPNYDGQWAEAFMLADGALYEALVNIGSIDADRPVLQPGVDAALVERFERVITDLQQLPDSDLPLIAVRMHEILAHIHRLDRKRKSGPPHTRLIDAACEALAEDFEQRIPLPQLAEELGIGYERFRKVFTEQLGMSPGEYRIRRRIDRARELIVQDGLSNKELAYALGYPDPFTFSKQFRRVVGESPAAFRKRMV